jgi:exosortase H (IPTLxxWG-CTERM-specific)
MLRFFSLFIFILTVLFVSELAAPIQSRLIIPFTETIAHISAGLIQLFDEKVIFRGVDIINTANGFAVSIQAGCNGVEAAIVLIAAILAFPASWLAKCVGVVVGFLSVQLLNILRIISLFYLGQWHVAVFNWAHLYIWQALIMLDVLIVFLLWLKYTPRPIK